MVIGDERNYCFLTRDQVLATDKERKVRKKEKKEREKEYIPEASRHNMCR